MDFGFKTKKRKETGISLRFFLVISSKNSGVSFFKMMLFKFKVLVFKCQAN